MSDGTNDGGFSADEERALASVLDEIIPPSNDGQLPGAGELGLISYINAALQNTPELRSMIVQGLSDLDSLARSRNAPGFAALSREDKLQLLNEQAFVLPLTFHTYAGYYQQARVVEALGLEARPPHPKGYHMEPNDFSLLDGVRRRPKLYRG
jgi:Gluconate 2-dehydrogenase subunit 3